MSLNRETMPNVSALAATIACSSSSALESATVFCCLAYVFKICEPAVTIRPDVLRPVFLHPAQPLSVYAVIVDGADCQANRLNSLDLQTKYLPILFNLSQSPTNGLAMFRAASFTAKPMSSRPGAR